MTRIVLDGDWRLYGFPEATTPAACPADLAASGVEPIAARVPGNVELDLERAGRLPDPFYGENMRLLRPFEFYEWWLVRAFDLPASAAGERWELVFAGLDTLAAIWVNGVEVGRAANMLIEQRFDVTAALRPGAANEIAVRLASAVNAARRYHYDASAMSWEHRHEGLFIRKPPHCWGWDIMPRAVSAGIWRPVWIESRPATALEQVYYWTREIHPGGATLGAHVQFRTDQADLDGFSLRFHGVCGAHTFACEHPVEFIADQCDIAVADARLWWPRGYGEPNLYTVTAQLCYRGQVVDERVERIGIRKVVVDRTETAGAASGAPEAAASRARLDQPPDPASHFVFYINDTPIMVKGSDWVPLDAFHSRDAERVERAVALYADLGCNMLRCWGGNVYEDHRFFDLCDEAGIMVWQDMAYACCRYPQTDEFLAEARRETLAVAEKLRNHASLALWCGDNENDMAYIGEGLSPQLNRLTREVIPQALHRADPYRHYVPSSPYVPPILEGAGGVWQRTPEQHLWGPRGYAKGPFYTRHSAHFIGEIGYHGCPNVSSLRRFLPPEQLWPWRDNAAWQAHSVYHWQQPVRERDRIKLMANQIRELFGLIPDDLDTFARASQVTQAEAVKFFIESTRLRKWRTSGILWWNVLDGWPQFSDAVVDYYWGKKLAYHYIRRVQQPVCLMIGEPGPGKYLPVVLANDTRAPADVRYRVWDGETGETAAEGGFAIPANENWQVDRLRTFASEQRLYLMTWQVGDQQFGNHYVVGGAPLSWERYERWLGLIAALPQPFEAERVGR